MITAIISANEIFGSLVRSLHTESYSIFHKEKKRQGSFVRQHGVLKKL